MRLSEAMRLGAMLSGHTIGALLADGNTCAMGAAYLAAGILSKRGKCRIDVAFKRFPIIGTAAPPCPACGRRSLADVVDTVIHLNDMHRWTRERIADWVEMLEGPPPAVPENREAVGSADARSS